MFKELLANPNAIDPVVLQKQAIERFYPLLKLSHLLPNERLDSNDKVNVVLWIATYSIYDLNLLDEINDNYDAWKNFAIVEVVNIADESFNIGNIPIEETRFEEPSMIVHPYGDKSKIAIGATDVINLLEEFKIL